MTLAARLIALGFGLLGLWMLVTRGDAESWRMGLAALLFSSSVGLADVGLRAQRWDVACGRARRRAGSTTFGPCRSRLGLMALSVLSFGAVPPLIAGGLLNWPSLLLSGPLVLAALVLAAWALDPRPVVVIDAGGVRDRRIMRRPAPWPAITATDEEEGLGEVFIRCDGAAAFAREGPLVAHGRRPDGFLIQTMLLDGDADDLAAALAASRPI